MDPRRAGKTHRWLPAVAVVAALGLFTALIAGSSLRPQFSAPAPPEPVAWSHAAAHVDQPTIKPVNKPVNKKPFHSMWMTQDRPQTWTRWSAQSARFALPASYAPSVFVPGGARSRSPAYFPHGQDLLTLLGVTRC